MIKRARFFLCALIVGGLSSCNLLPLPNAKLTDQVGAAQYETVTMLLTETAQVTGDVTPTPINWTVTSQPTPVTKTQVTRKTAISQDAVTNIAFTKTPLPDNTQLVIRTQSTAQESQTLILPCNLAQPGRPFDLTVPDDSQVAPGEYFSKTWRLINAGHCNWTADYAIVWFSGEDMGASHTQPLGVNVMPGNTVDVTIDMMAPSSPGIYQSNWKLLSSQGEMFGIGPSGDAPFWVRIMVMQVSTETPTPLPPQVTPTALVYSNGQMQLSMEQGVDLDSGVTDQGERNDVVLQVSPEGHSVLAPVNGSRLAVYGLNVPELTDCMASPAVDSPVVLQELPLGTYFCYRTSQGMPGRLYFSSLDQQQNLLTLEFSTWAVP